MKPRNKLAHDPILSKGGAHEKSGKAKRAQEKRSLRRSLKEID